LCNMKYLDDLCWCEETMVLMMENKNLKELLIVRTFTIVFLFH
jgi:hypothetical protein